MTGNVNNFNYLALHAKPSDAVKEIDGLVDVYDNISESYGQVSCISVVKLQINQY